jgi:hypothetical protein
MEFHSDSFCYSPSILTAMKIRMKIKMGDFYNSHVKIRMTSMETRTEEAPLRDISVDRLILKLVRAHRDNFTFH